MSTIDTASAFAGATNERSPSAKFHTLGTTYKGRIARIDEFTGINSFNGKEETSVTIDIELAESTSTTDPKSGETFSFGAGDTVTLFCRTHLEGQVVPNGITRAIADAVRSTGRVGLPEVGGQLAVRYEANGQASKAGMSPPKIYRAQYQPPSSVPTTQQGGPFDSSTPAPQAEQPQAAAAPQPSSDLF
jgi:hypothetical protein